MISRAWICFRNFAGVFLFIFQLPRLLNASRYVTFSKCRSVSTRIALVFHNKSFHFLKNLKADLGIGTFKKPSADVMTNLRSGLKVLNISLPLLFWLSTGWTRQIRHPWIGAMWKKTLNCLGENQNYSLVDTLKPLPHGHQYHTCCHGTTLVAMVKRFLFSSPRWRPSQLRRTAWVKLRVTWIETLTFCLCANPL